MAMEREEDGLHLEAMAKEILEALPIPVFIVDDDVVIHAANRTALGWVDAQKQLSVRRRLGDELHCIHSFDVEEGCGRGPYCQDCPIRRAVGVAFHRGETVHRTVEVELLQNGKTRKYVWLILTHPLVHSNGETYVVLSVQDTTELHRLRGLLPICANCKKIRDDDGYWRQVEDYFHEHTGAEFTHALCEDCVRQLYPGLAEDLLDENGGD
jgi:PAS domain-containing protein